MILPAPRGAGVDDSRGGCCVLGEFQSHGSSNGTIQGRGPAPSRAQGGQGEDQIFVLEGDWEEEFTASRLVCGWPWGVSYCVFQ